MTGRGELLMTLHSPPFLSKVDSYIDKLSGWVNLIEVNDILSINAS